MSFIGNSKIAARVDVYDAELRDKVAELEAQVETAYADGQKSEYDRFWDSYQQNGELAYYFYAFAGHGWNDENFKPKYDIKPTQSASYLFYYNSISGDLVEILQKLGVELDTSKATNLSSAFNSMPNITRIGVINATGATTPYALGNAFTASRKLKTIDKIILTSDGSISFSSTFNQCVALENITFEGVIGQSINFQNCPLTVESMESIIHALKNYSGTDEAYTQTLYFSEECWARLDEAYPDIVQGWDSYKNYINYNLGWNT